MMHEHSARCTFAGGGIACYRTPVRPLLRHDGTPAPAVAGIAVDVARTGPGSLRLTFCLRGTVDRLRIPPPRPPRIVTDLWRHTCFEAFVKRDGEAAYHELNFSPSGEWGAFAFRTYRDGGPLGDAPPAPRMVVRRSADLLELEAEVALGSLSPTYPAAALRIGLSAVVEDETGTLSYWALRHPPGKPDFHHETAFALRLEPPPTAC